MHAPDTQADATHGDAVLHWPFTSHVCTPLFEHVFVPGAQTPEHVPPTQAWFEHAVVFCQVPDESHV